MMSMMNMRPLVSYSDYEISAVSCRGKVFNMRFRTHYPSMAMLYRVHVLGWQLENLGLASEPQPVHCEAVTLTTATTVRPFSKQ